MFFDVFPKTNGVPRSIEGVQDLKALALDGLLGKLLTHKIHLKEDEEEDHTKRGVAFRTTNEELYSSYDESSEGNEDSMAIIGQGLKNMFRLKRFDPRSSTKRNLHQRNMRKIRKLLKPLTIK